MRTFLLLTLSVLMITACGPREAEVERPDEVVIPEENTSRIRGWFTRPPQIDRIDANVVYGELVPEVRSLRLDRTADGVIILATTLVPQTAAFDVSLRSLNNGLPDDDGFLSFEFRYDETSELRPPLTDRQLRAAEFVSTADLASARGVRVFAAQNNRSVRR